MQRTLWNLAFYPPLACVFAKCAVNRLPGQRKAQRRSFMRELAAQEGRSQKPDDVDFSWFVDVTQTCFVLFLRPFSAEDSPTTRKKRKGGRSVVHEIAFASPSFVIAPSRSTYMQEHPTWWWWWWWWCRPARSKIHTCSLNLSIIPVMEKLEPNPFG